MSKNNHCTSTMLLIMAAIGCSYPSPSCAAELTFHEHIHNSCQEFKRTNQRSIYYRYLAYGLIGAGFGAAFFRNALPSASRSEEKIMYHKVQALLQKHEATTVLAAPSPGWLKQSLQSIACLGTGFISWFISDRLLSTAAYVLVTPLIEPIQRLMSSERTLLAGDVWFLREQVRESRAAFVLVSRDLSDFIDELKAWESEVRYLKLLAQGIPSSDVLSNEAFVQYHEVITATRKRIGYRMARILGHIMYMHSKTTSFERYIMEILQSTFHQQIEKALHQLTESYNTQEKAIMQHAITLFEQSIKSTLLPLLSVSLYRIHPWPAAVACSDYAQSFVTSVITNYGNPLTH